MTAGPSAQADLNRLLASLCSRLRRALGDGAVLQLGFSAGLPAVLLDPGRLEADLVRLLRTAARELPPGSPLRLYTCREGSGPLAGAMLRIEAGAKLQAMVFPPA